MKTIKIGILISLVWSTLVAVSFLWTYANAKKEQERTALQSAKSFFNQIVITRLWNARHGGVYVPVTQKTQPNKYLKVPLRDIKVNDRLTLTKVNPSFMTRQLSEIAMEQESVLQTGGLVQFHLTSLKPIRPQNKPTEMEEQFLRAFEKGVKEKGVFTKNSYFYMAPLRTTKSCLRCHAKQGYKESDIRGGISITSSSIMKIPFLSLFLSHFAIGLAGLLGIFLAMRRLSRAYETIRIQAAFDALTGIPNRGSFSESLLKEYERSRRNRQTLSIIMCDVDYFKAYNDTYGHSNGDLCLEKIAQTIKASLKRPGDFCARYGGEEFVVILPNTPIEGAMHIAEKIRSNIEKLAIPHKSSLSGKVVTISIGAAASAGTDLESHEELVKQADNALYLAKELGRNQVQSFRGTA